MPAFDHDDDLLEDSLDDTSPALGLGSMGLPARAGTAGSRPSSATRKPGSAFSSAMQDDGTADRSAPSSSGFGLGTFLPQRSSSSGSRPSSASKYDCTPVS
eukprot:gene15320-18125_t